MAKIRDRVGCLDRLKTNTLPYPVTLDLGCGAKKFSASSIGVDICDHPEVDVIGDVFDVLSEVPTSSVDSVVSSHFIEHVDDVSKLLRACRRVVRPGGSISIVVPHFSNPYFYSDPTHRTFFGLYTLCYYAECSFFKRTIPSYERIPGLSISSIDLVFKSYRPN